MKFPEWCIGSYSLRLDHPSSSSHTYSLLPSLPSPSPEQLGPTAVKQLMTWGTLQATPRIISQSGSFNDDDIAPGTPFRINRPSAREVIGLKLSNDAAKSLREKAAQMKGPSRGIRSLSSLRGVRDNADRMPPPPATPKKAEALGALTPAARRLLGRTTSGIASSRRAEAMDKSAGWDGSKQKEKDMNKVRWTPSPAPVAKRDG